MFKELKETISKDLNEFIRMRDYQIENTKQNNTYIIEIIKWNQIENPELKNTIPEMKN